MEPHPTLHDSIRQAQRDVAAPTVVMQMRDILLTEVTRAVLPKVLGTPDWTPETIASGILNIVDAVMAARQPGVDRCLEEIEVWGRKRLRSEGIALRTNVDVLLTAMIFRFGGSVEIPISELQETDAAVSYIEIDEDKERGVLRATPVHPPKDPLHTLVS